MFRENHHRKSAFGSVYCVYALPLFRVKLRQLVSIKQMPVRLNCDSELANEQRENIGR